MLDIASGMDQAPVEKAAKTTAARCWISEYEVTYYGEERGGVSRPVLLNCRVCVRI